jgi:hypothetical protein
MTIAMQPIYTQTVGAGGASSITFNNIPQTFTDLMVSISSRETSSTPYSGISVRLNNDASALYSGTLAEGYGSAASSRTTGADSLFPIPHIVGGSATANTFGNAQIYIPNYTASTFKSLIIDSVTENNSNTTFSFQTGLSSGLYRSTSTITAFRCIAAGSFAQHSTFSLYGITKG